MTRPNALVLDGSEIKMRLEAERVETGSPVHVDWLRFTCDVKFAPWPSVEELFPKPVELDFFAFAQVSEVEDARRRVAKILQDMPQAEFSVSSQAKTLAEQVCAILGQGFTVEPELRKGHDFYRYRWSIVRFGAEVGWVGFLASGESPRQSAQAKTIHCNLYGMACTFAQHGWREAMADLVDEVHGKITRIDLALDFFDGISGGLDRIRQDWHDSLMDCYGKRPKANTVGPWVEGGRGRSFYWGSKEGGKQTNAYEKGVQLFGEKDATRWERIELRYGNKLRVLGTDMLRRPADFFAGASDWHAAILREHGEVQAVPEPIKCTRELPSEMVAAELVRVIRWLRDVAGPSLTMAMQYLSETQIAELMFNHKLPGRLQKFSPAELAQGAKSAYQHVTKGAGWATVTPSLAH